MVARRCLTEASGEDQDGLQLGRALIQLWPPATILELKASCARGRCCTCAVGSVLVARAAIGRWRACKALPIWLATLPTTQRKSPCGRDAPCNLSRRPWRTGEWRAP